MKVERCYISEIPRILFEEFCAPDEVSVFEADPDKNLPLEQVSPVHIGEDVFYCVLVEGFTGPDDSSFHVCEGYPVHILEKTPDGEFKNRELVIGYFELEDGDQSCAAMLTKDIEFGSSFARLVMRVLRRAEKLFANPYLPGMSDSPP